MKRETSERLAVVASALGNSAHDAPNLARLAGFRGLLFNVWSSSLSIPDLSTTGRREFLHLLNAQAQQLVGLSMDLGPKGLSPGADVDRQIDRIDRGMEAAAGLGAPLLCVDLGLLPAANIAPAVSPPVSKQQAGLIIIPEAAPPPVVQQAAPPDPAFVSQLNAALAQIGSHADRYGAMIAFSSSLAGFAALEQALGSVNCPWFGVDLDPVAMLKDLWTPDEIFTMLGPLVRHVRARDAVTGSEGRSKPAIIGRGGTQWAELLGLLDEVGYHGFLTIDPLDLPDRAAGAAAGAAHLLALPR